MSAATAAFAGSGRRRNAVTSLDSASLIAFGDGGAVARTMWRLSLIGKGRAALAALGKVSSGKADRTNCERQSVTKIGSKLRHLFP
jgi:hypothetical protein